MTTISDLSLHPSLRAALHPEVLALGPSLVGAACARLLTATTLALYITPTDYKGIAGLALETDVRRKLVDAAATQCNVWLFG